MSDFMRRLKKQFWWKNLQAAGTLVDWKWTYNKHNEISNKATNGTSKTLGQNSDDEIEQTNLKRIFSSTDDFITNDHLKQVMSFKESDSNSEQSSESKVELSNLEQKFAATDDFISNDHLKQTAELKAAQSSSEHCINLQKDSQGYQINSHKQTNKANTVKKSDGDKIRRSNSKQKCKLTGDSVLNKKLKRAAMLEKFTSSSNHYIDERKNLPSNPNTSHERPLKIKSPVRNTSDNFGASDKRHRRTSHQNRSYRRDHDHNSDYDAYFFDYDDFYSDDDYSCYNADYSGYNKRKRYRSWF